MSGRMEHMTASPGDLLAAQRISEWTEQYGGDILRQLTRAQRQFSEAVTQCDERPGPATVERMRQAAAALADVAERALEGPWAGVPEYDDPRREGLEMCAKGARKIVSGEGSESAILVARGEEVTAVANEYARDLTVRVQRYFGQA